VTGAKHSAGPGSLSTTKTWLFSFTILMLSCYCHRVGWREIYQTRYG